MMTVAVAPPGALASGDIEVAERTWYHIALPFADAKDKNGLLRSGNESDAFLIASPRNDWWLRSRT
jgi:hypothetical protein